MTAFEYLTTEDLLELAAMQGVGPVREIALLETAALRPASSVFGSDAYPTLEHKAAALLHSLARNHPLVDGNKRLAWLALHTFVVINGHQIHMDDEDVFQLVMSVAAGELEADEIAPRLKIAPRDPA